MNDIPTVTLAVRRYSRGMTLMELMVVVVIVGILASIAYPSYRNQVLRSKRSEAKSELMQSAQKLERCFTANNSYVGCTSLTLPYTTPNNTYQIKVKTAITANAYQLFATPQGGQAADSCGELSLDQANAKTPTTTGCW